MHVCGSISLCIYIMSNVHCGLSKIEKKRSSSENLSFYKKKNFANYKKGKSCGHDDMIKNSTRNAFECGLYNPCIFYHFQENQTVTIYSSYEKKIHSKFSRYKS